MYSRELDGQELTLAASGWTYGQTFVLLDRETQTLWFPVSEGLKGIQGKHFRRVLPEMDFSRTTWGRWLREHPESRILP